MHKSAYPRPISRAKTRQKVPQARTRPTKPKRENARRTKRNILADRGFLLGQSQRSQRRRFLCSEGGWGDCGGQGGIVRPMRNVLGSGEVRRRSRVQRANNVVYGGSEQMADRSITALSHIYQIERHYTQAATTTLACKYLKPTYFNDRPLPLAIQNPSHWILLHQPPNHLPNIISYPFPR
jgi:hypothetical protein